MKKSTNTKKARGFTIVELLVVIVVIGILAAISIVSYSGVTDKANDTALKQFASDVEGSASIYLQNDTNAYVPTTKTLFTTDASTLAKVNSATYDKFMVTSILPTATAGTVDTALAPGKAAYFACQSTASGSALATLPSAPTGAVLIYNATNANQTVVTATTKIDAIYIGTATATNFTDKFCYKAGA